MIETFLAQQTALSLDRTLSRPEMERISLLIEMDRSRPSYRRWLAGRLVRLGMLLDPAAAVLPPRAGVARPEPSSR